MYIYRTQVRGVQLGIILRSSNLPETMRLPAQIIQQVVSTNYIDDAKVQTKHTYTELCEGLVPGVFGYDSTAYNTHKNPLLSLRRHCSRRKKKSNDKPPGVNLNRLQIPKKTK